LDLFAWTKWMDMYPVEFIAVAENKVMPIIDTPDSDQDRTVVHLIQLSE
jgi:hypothetical protein